MPLVSSWTGASADALRQALRMTNETFAEHLGIAVRTVAYWRVRPDVVPRPSMQEILDTALIRAPAEAQELFAVIAAERRAMSRPAHLTAITDDDDIDNFTTWLSATNTSDAAIERASHAAARLAGMHTRVPARQLLPDVLQLHGATQVLLRDGRQHLHQTRELLHAEGMTLAHASVLLSDLGRHRDAERHGKAAVLCLKEADASQATGWYALAKTARWQRKYQAAAELASRGFETGPVTPMSVQLASYEANSAALLGDVRRARQALDRAEMIAEMLPEDADPGSPWGFPAQRRTVFRMSVLLRTGDPQGALRAAADADAQWAAGDEHIPGTWAQVRIGAAIARLLHDAPDGAADELAPVFAGMPPEFRIATVTGWLADLDARLADRPYSRSPEVIALREHIRDFTAEALPSTQEAS